MVGLMEQDLCGIMVIHGKVKLVKFIYMAIDLELFKSKLINIFKKYCLVYKLYLWFMSWWHKPILSEEGIDMAGRSFEVSLTLSVVENQEDGSTKPFFDNVLNYHDMPYSGVTVIEAVLIDALKKLNDLGFLSAEGGQALTTQKAVQQVLGK